MRESDSAVLIANDADQMRAIGASLAAALANNLAIDPATGRGSISDSAAVISLRGELGAGKTTLVGGVLNALGHRGPVRSPTYTLIEPYDLSGRPVYHLDLYRLIDPAEVEGLGVRDLLAGNSLLLIEWPEKGGDFVPAADLEVSIDYAGVGRQLRVSAHSPVGRALKRAFAAVAKP
jgi:tRNA threonylcarbamoyladenosine biosynthesis protein TsaE